MDEIFGLVRMKRHYDEGEFDVLIIDSAPTGTALRPELTGSKWVVYETLTNHFKTSRAETTVEPFAPLPVFFTR